MPQLTYIEAITTALREEMARDEKVFLIGEDIGAYGGAFKATKDLQKEFGVRRVIDTPISETAIIGTAIGAALRGYRPVAEMQFSDFITNGFNQVVSVAGTTAYRWGIGVPIVIRLPSGAGVSGGPFHSRNPEVWFAHSPGLKVVCPSTPTDARGLLKTAVRDNNPVLYFEHKHLYRKIKEEINTDVDGAIAFGEARIVREGSDATIVTYGVCVHHALEAAEKLFAERRNVEVIDIRTLVPYDKETVFASVKKTGRVLVAHEDNMTAGFGAEIAAQIAEFAFEYLDAPVMRIASPDVPVPFTPLLEKEVIPSSTTIEAGLKKLLAY